TPDAGGPDVAAVRIETVPGASRCDLKAVVARLAELEINTVWLEAGPTLTGAMLAAGLVDELILYLAPCLLGDSARDLLVLPELTSLDARQRLQIDDIRKVGEDLRIVARPVAD
ncbi:MAG: dihydrofolate reductase family protein, partial [Gammaproteobacteria bacterium]|nr:dihydrofolate reductase family protein [Gammaproteobacteria bacterium]